MPLRRALLIPVLSLSLAAQSLPLPEAARKLQEASMASEAGYQKLAWLCDRIGHRLSGSPQLDQAIRWAVETMRAEGFDEVRTEKVMVPHWVRGRERGELLSPNRVRVNLLGLGGTAPTPKGGITADVVVVGGFEELKALGEAKVKGRIVCYDVPFENYGTTVQYRSRGASEAAKLGAVAALVRSVTPVSLDSPHTGAMIYQAGVPRIPAAGITLEAATQMRRMQARGERVTMRLELENRTLPDAESANVIAEIRGREKPEEIVLLSGHLDSWDVGQGAQDDGVGCMTVWEAARLLKATGLRPRRTLRVVLFTNEENGLRGGYAYRDAHKEELKRHVALLESDTGNGLVKGFTLDLRGPEARQALARLSRFGPELAPGEELRIELGQSGADVGPSVELGIPGIGVSHDHTRYWDVHHTWADTFDKVDKAILQKNIARVAAMAYALADMEERLK